MNNIHTEKAFEEAIEFSLLSEGGYVKGNSENFDSSIALDTLEIINFLKVTQSKEWKKLSSIHGKEVEAKFIDRVIQELGRRGMLDVIRNGVADYGVNFQMAYLRPLTTLNPKAASLYKLNKLLIYRQVHYARNNNNSLDMMIGLNGLPIATLELKNPLTNQNVDNAIEQYETTRSPNEPIFQFKKRALVHFAVDTDEVYMTTKLSGKTTKWLPFNLGYNDGKGNPKTNSYRTTYLWKKILVKDSLMDILGRFLHLQKEEMIFPRFHQLECVRSLIDDAKVAGAGKNYLIQHSAGSGKSNSIAWLSYHLSSLHTDKNERVFNSVIVVTDRRVLDDQLQDTIYQFPHEPGVVQKIDKNSNQLANVLKAGSNIIITTLQKFPFVLEKVETLPSRKYAVIVDEAHSSQSGEAAKKLKEVLSAKTLEEAEKKEADKSNDIDIEDEIRKEMRLRGQQQNLSFFAFTATPKPETIEVFGTKGSDGIPKPFHLYSMKQAIEEGFIHDVLRNYTTYKTFYRLSKSIEANPEVDKLKAVKAIARFVSLHPHNLSQKTEVIIEHFRQKSAHKMGGAAKAMLVTRSRLHAVRYKQEFDRYLEENQYTDIKVLVAFSGKVTDPDIKDKEYSETEMNGFPEKEMPERFGSLEYQLLLVADKYQTGFDQPLLHTMYVDKHLSGVRAVQTLSRLNRTYPGKEDTFVLDFCNDREEIKKAFQDYYKMTSIEETPDHDQLYAIKSKIDETQIIWKTDIDALTKLYFGSKKSFTPNDQGKLNSFIDPSVDRFKQIKNKEDKESLEAALRSFVKLYSYLSQIIPFPDPELEKFFIYSRFLINKLPKKINSVYNLSNQVNLEYYRLQEMKESDAIYLADENSKHGAVIARAGKSIEKETNQLSEIIRIINERFGTEFKKEDGLIFKQVKEDCMADKDLINQGNEKINSMSNFKLVFREFLCERFIERCEQAIEGNEQHKEIYLRIMEDQALQNTIVDLMCPMIYGQINEDVSA